MNTLLLILLATCLYSGCFAFALSQAKHWKVVFPGKLPLTSRGRLGLQVLGAGLCLTALAAALLRDGPSFGILLWVLALSAAAFAVAGTLALLRL